jgi:hypothetical protein
MKPKQLANVLIKILGLSMCAHGITPAAQLFLQIFASGTSVSMFQNQSMGMPFNMTPFYFFANFVPVGIGIFLMLLSRTVTAILFSDEE